MKLYLSILLFFIACGTLLAQNEIFHRAKIAYKNPESLKELSLRGVALDHGIHKKGHFIISDFSGAEISIAQTLGFQVTILTQDIQKVYVEQNSKSSPNYRAAYNTSCETNSNESYETPANYTAGSMGGFFTYEEVLQNLDAMQAQYPDLISQRAPISNFLTAENRPIQWLKITKDPDAANTRPQVLYTAIHHAREPASLSQLLFFMWYLLENYDSSPEIKNIVDNTELYFIPLVNPDGYIHNQTTNPNGGGLWRKNRRDHGNGTFGVDNNRNYDYWIDGDANQSVWNTTGTSPTTDGETYAGSAPFSEPENQAVKFFVENHNFLVALNAHTFSELLLYPYGYESNAPTPDNDLFEEITTYMVSKNGYNNIISSELYAASGTSDDFMYGQTFNHDKIFSLTPEIGSSFWPAANSILNINKEMMFTNIVAARMVSNFAVLQDNTPSFIGENANFQATFSIQKISLLGAGDFTISINPISTNIAAVGAPITISNLENLETQAGSISISLAPGTNSSDPIIYEYVVNNGSFDQKFRVSKTFGKINTLFEDLGNSVTDNFTNNGWDTTAATFMSAPSSITDSPNGDYNNNENKTITLNEPINLTNALGAQVTFFTKWDIESGWDYVQFEISIDGGATWVPQCGKYTNTGSQNGTQPEGEPLYDGTNLDWVQEKIDLSDYLGETLLARFELVSDSFQTADGFYFDDLTFTVIENSTLSTTNPEISQFSVYPNPTQSLVNINSNFDAYSIKIYSVQGKEISNIVSHTSLKTIDLKTYANGMYFLVLSAGDISETFKLIKN